MPATTTMATTMPATMRLLLFLSLALGLLEASPNIRDNDYYDDQAGDYNYEYGDDSVQDDVDGQSRELNSISTFRPDIISQPEHLVVDNGMTISLPCVVDRMPAGVQIIWQKLDNKKTIIAIGNRVIDPQLINRAFVTVTHTGSTLAIGAAKTEDAGQYKCEVAVQQTPPELTHTVSIRAPPSILSSSPASITVDKGQDVTLSCKGTGSPKPRIQWSKVGHKMPGGELTLDNDVITFSRVTRKDAGIYKCTASNGHGTGASKEMAVVVRYRPEVEVSEVFVHKKRGDSAELVCTVHAYPPATVTWTKGGVAVAGSDRLEVINRGGRHRLVFKEVDQSDFGSYVCSANNNLGSGKDQRVELSGHPAPADYRSSPTGSKPHSFLIEWSSFSFTPIQEWRLETRLGDSGPWVPHPLPRPPTKEDTPYQWAGKHYVTQLEGATQYQARVTARNEEGWGKPGPAWNFATKGAEPSVKAGAGRPGVTLLLLTAILVTRANL